MLRKRIILITAIFLLVSSCGETWSSVKRGLTGAKSKSADEFMVKKKDPLIMPPDFENLPSPSDEIIDDDELTSLKETLGQSISEESDATTSGSAEESILKKIRKK